MITLQAGGAELLDLVQPLWEKLNTQHWAQSRYFAAHYAGLTFEVRKQAFLAPEIAAVKVDLIHEDTVNQYIGYCISTIHHGPNASYIGELDSLYVDPAYRGKGLGDELVTRSVAYMDSFSVMRKKISVAEGNESVFGFYAKHGFKPKLTVLESV